MSINKYEPHLLVLPEDDANRKIANGFILHCHNRRCGTGWTYNRNSEAWDRT